MKKLGCSILAWILLLSMLTTASAATIVDTTAYVPNPMEMELAVSVGARESGTGGSYEAALPIVFETNSQKGVDYKATLDMAPVRALFDEDFITIMLLADEALRAEFNAGVVTTTVKVAISYPAAARIGANLNSPSVGVLESGGIFRETNRRLDGNTLTISYANRAGLTAGTLMQNKDVYLSDISFLLNDVVSYNSAGNHKVSVTLSGKTEIAFASKTQVVEYVGGSSHIVTSTEGLFYHVLEVEPAVPATCTADGKTESIICRTHNSYDCGALGIVRPGTTPQIPHTKINFARVEPTCAVEGIAAHETCSMCKTDFVGGDIVTHESLIIPATGAHTPSAISGVAPTCVKSGLSAGEKCAECGRILTAQTVIPATGHTGILVPGHAATCTIAGLTDGERCACGTVLVSQKIIPATGHNFGEWTTGREPSETATGEKTRTCQNACGTTEVVEIPKLTHVCVAREELAVVTVRPTCTEEGKKQPYCSCGLPVGAPVLIPATGHTLSHITAISATCTAAGVTEHYACVVCNKNFRDTEGKYELKSIIVPQDKNNHAGNEVSVPGLAATCIREGVTAAEKCKACNLILTPHTIIPKAPHTLETVAYKAATCEEHGVLEHKHCAVCNADFEMDGATRMEKFDIPAIGHKYGEISVTTPPTEEAEGAGTRICLHDPTHVKSVTIAKLQHTHNEIVEEIIVRETCTAEGKKRKVHSCCGEVLEDNIVIAPHAHTPVLVPSVYATCHAEGMGAYYKCTECGKLFSGSDMTKEISAPTVLAKTEHEWVTISQNAAGHVKKCRHCNEVVNTKKETSHVTVDVKHHGGMKDRADRVLEDVVTNIRVETEIRIIEREDVSNELHAAIGEDAAEEKVSLDIEIEKVTKYEGSEDEDRETISETDDLVQIVIEIPTALRGKGSYAVYRMHGAEAHMITTRPNADGEYIEVKRSQNQIILHAKKFSEYALVAYEAETAPTISGNVKPTVKTYSVTFRANGGSVTETQMVQGGQLAKEPVTTREGYVFAGWYTDAAFETKFDFATPIQSNMTLYAKWELQKAEPSIILVIGDKTAIVYGTAVENDVAPKIVNDRTMLPIRLVAEALGGVVGWAEETRTVTIKTVEGTEIKITVGENKATVNGKEVELDAVSFIENDRTYLPIRFVAENLGALVEWEAETQRVLITKEQPKTIVLTIGRTTAVVFGIPVENDVAPKIVNDRTMLPIRFVAEALGATVGWEEETRMVTIKMGETAIGLVVGEAKAVVDGNEITLDVASFIENSRTYLPVRFVSETLGAKVDWDAEMQTVTITK